MFSIDALRDLYRHMEWADAAVWHAVPIEGVDDKLRRWLLHIHVVQQAFLRVWTNRPVDDLFREPESFATMRDLQAWAAPYYAEATAFMDSLSEERLAAPVVLPWAAQLTEVLGRAPAAPTLGETCLQVANHSTYHRGQVNARLRELGAEPPLVDYIAWIWFGRPSPVWPKVDAR